MHPQSESSYTSTALGPAWPAYDSRSQDDQPTC